MKDGKQISEKGMKDGKQISEKGAEEQIKGAESKEEPISEKGAESTEMKGPSLESILHSTQNMKAYYDLANGYLQILLPAEIDPRIRVKVENLSRRFPSEIHVDDAMPELESTVLVIEEPDESKHLFEGKEGLMYEMMRWICATYAQPHGWKKAVLTSFSAVMLMLSITCYLLIEDTIISGVFAVFLLGCGFLLLMIGFRAQFIAAYDWVMYLYPAVDCLYRVSILLNNLFQIYHFRDNFKNLIINIKDSVLKMFTRQRTDTKVVDFPRRAGFGKRFPKFRGNRTGVPKS